MLGHKISWQEKYPPYNCHHKNTFGHKLVICNGIFISTVQWSRIRCVRVSRCCRCWLLFVFFTANWLGDYFAWTIRVKHPNNFTVHEYLTFFTFTPCFILVNIFFFQFGSFPFTLLFFLFYFFFLRTITEVPPPNANKYDKWVFKKKWTKKTTTRRNIEGYHHKHIWI